MIDWSRVRELKDEVGADAFEEVVELFLEEVEEDILRLQGGERSQLEQDLHFLKGSALNLGFQNFSDLCLDGERLSSEGQASRVDVAKILQSYAASKTGILSEMAENG